MKHNKFINESIGYMINCGKEKELQIVAGSAADRGCLEEWLQAFWDALHEAQEVREFRS